MSKKRDSLRGKGADIAPAAKGTALFTKAKTKEKEEDKISRDIEPKKSRTIYEQANYQLFPEQAKKIRIYAAQNKMKVSEVVRKALQEFIDKQGI